MADRVTAMLDRLPPPYAIDAGSTIHQVLSVVGLQQKAFDEDMDRVQRTHWVDHAFDLADLAKLGALFGAPPAPWEPRQLYRARLKATIAAMLRGSVTRGQLDYLLAQILGAAQQALDTRYLDVGSPTPGGPPALPFVEFPPRLRRSAGLVERQGLLRPLDTFTLVNEGIDPAPLQFALRGVPGHRTAMPLVVNRTNGHALGLRAVVQAGKELTVRASADDDATVTLDGADVGDRAYSTRSFQPGPGTPPLTLDDPLQPIMLERGPNVCWLISLAHYDDPGLDAAMLGVAAEDMHQGRFGDGAWGSAVFYQEPVGGLDAWWVERAPASFRFHIPAGAVLRTRGARPEPEADRAALFRLMQDSLDRTRAAAVAGAVHADRLAETQRSEDRVAVLAPVATTEQASAGEDFVVATGARFDGSPRERARFE